MAVLAVNVIFIFIFLNLVYSDSKNPFDQQLPVSTSHYVFWPNATIPFHINPDHFDNEQSLIIMRALSNFAFHTCLKFAPVMVPPAENDHVLAFHNPGGTRKCEVAKYGHPREGPHMVHLGYECLKSPNLEMIVMRALGFPFEHNRAIRDAFIDVQEENIEPGALELYTKEYRLPAAMRPLPYDVNSVLHFGERDHSKNGHRTIIFKDRNTKQNREGLSETDKKKIELVYGPECRTRDRQEKIELCHQYPGGTSDQVRKKREIDTTKSLRVNPDITPPPESSSNNLNLSEDVSASLKSLGIEAEVQEVVENVYRLSAKALKNARKKYCNETKEILRSGDSVKSSSDVLGIIRVVSNYAQSVVDHAVGNMSAFCEESESLQKYQRYRCGGDDSVCPHSYKSTLSGRVIYSTQHRPIIIQSTKHVGAMTRVPKDPIWRSGSHNETEEENSQTEDPKVETPEAETSKPVRRKRETDEKDLKVEDTKSTLEVSKDSREKSVKTEMPEVVLRMGTKLVPRRDVPYDRSARRDDRDDGFMRAREDRDEDSERDSSKSKSKEVEDRKPAQKKLKFESKEEIEDSRPKQKKLKPNVVEEAEEEKKISEEEELVKPKRPHVKPKTVQLSKKNEEFYSQRRWPDGVVRYVIDKSSNFDLADLRNRLDEVKRILKEKTCVRVEEIWEKDAHKFEDYLVIDNSPDFVTGRVGGKQIFGSSELLKGGQHRQHAAMMVMAMLGFYFEVSRHDRDKYVRVHVRHVRADKIHHFEKIRSDATLPLPYDYKSATHPAWQFWRKVGKTGISTVATYKDQDPDGSIMKSLGQNEELLSEGDIIKINSVYGTKCMEDSRRKGHKKHHRSKRNRKRHRSNKKTKKHRSTSSYENESTD